MKRVGGKYPVSNEHFTKVKATEHLKTFSV